MEKMKCNYAYSYYMYVAVCISCVIKKLLIKHNCTLSSKAKNSPTSKQDKGLDWCGCVAQDEIKTLRTRFKPDHLPRHYTAVSTPLRQDFTTL